MVLHGFVRSAEHMRYAASPSYSDEIPVERPRPGKVTREKRGPETKRRDVDIGGEWIPVSGPDDRGDFGYFQ